MPTYDEAEALESAEDDWNTDVGPDQTTMTRTTFARPLGCGGLELFFGAAPSAKNMEQKQLL